MKINRNGQLWEFIDRYVTWYVTREVSMYGTDVCRLVRMFLVATLKCSGITALVSVVLAALVMPWYMLYLTGSVAITGEISFPNIITLIGACLQFAILGTLAIRYILIEGLTWFFYGIRWLVHKGEERSRAKQKPPKPESETVRVVREYIAGIKGKYCTRIELA
jgi:hypothetical protein